MKGITTTVTAAEGAELHMREFTFTITATFEAEDETDAWNQWTEWLTEPRHLEEGTREG